MPRKQRLLFLGSVFLASVGLVCSVAPSTNAVQIVPGPATVIGSPVSGSVLTGSAQTVVAGFSTYQFGLSTINLRLIATPPVGPTLTYIELGIGAGAWVTTLPIGFSPWFVPACCATVSGPNRNRIDFSVNVAPAPPPGSSVAISARGIPLSGPPGLPTTISVIW